MSPDQEDARKELAEIKANHFEEPDFSEDDLATADRALDDAAAGAFDDVDYAKINAPLPRDDA